MICHDSTVHRPVKPETTREIMAAGLGTCLGGLIVFLSSPFLIDLWGVLGDIALPKLSKQGHLSLLATLFLLCILLSLLLYHRSSKGLLLRKYELIRGRGFSQHRRTGQRVCTSCLTDGIESPLIPLVGTGMWRCARQDCSLPYERREGET